MGLKYCQIVEVRKIAAGRIVTRQGSTSCPLDICSTPNLHIPGTRTGGLPAMQITDNLFLACCQCPFKAYLRSQGEVGIILEYEAIQTEADARFGELAVEHWNARREVTR